MPLHSRHLRRLSLSLLTGILAIAARATEPGSAEPDLFVSPERMRTFDQWRFGLFIHWGPWSQTAQGSIWNIQTKMNETERAKAFELNRTFNPVGFAPEKWAAAARDAGMKYVVFVTKHHDGFNNYDTHLSDHKITAPETPYASNSRADLTRAVTDAFRAQGLGVGLYFSHIDWYHPDGKYFSLHSPVYDAGRVETDPASWHRFADYEKGQVRELLTHYGKVDLVWFDIAWPFAGSHTRVTNPVVRADVLDLLGEMKSLQPDIIFDDRGTDIYGGYVTPEQRVPEQGPLGSWETCMTITNGGGFWYKGRDADCKTVPEIIRTLIDVASKGGNFLLDVGPGPDGDFIPGEYRALAGVGQWLRTNGPAIYGTERSRWLTLPWGRSTTRGRTLYLLVENWPSDGRLVVPGLRSAVTSASFLADPSHPPLAVEARGLDKIITVGPRPLDPVATVIAVNLAGDPDVLNLNPADRTGAFQLKANQARIDSAAAHPHFAHAVLQEDYITQLCSPNDRVIWDLMVDRAGRYRVTLEYAALPAQAGVPFTLQFNASAPLSGSTHSTVAGQDSLPASQARKARPGKGNADSSPAFGSQDLGSVAFGEAGPQRLTLAPGRSTEAGLFRLRAVTLTPIAD